MSQKQWREYIAELLKTNDVAVYRAILILYALQTNNEKMLSQTTESNKLGFGNIDARYFSNLAEKINHHVPLTDHEMARSRNVLKKYWKQLMLVAQGEIIVDIGKPWVRR